MEMMNPDRRPIGMIWTGPVQWTLEQINGTPNSPYSSFKDQLKKRPWHRFILGWPAAQVGASGAQYYPLPLEKRLAYQAAYRSARAHKKFSLGMYGGIVWEGKPFTQEILGEWKACDFFNQSDHYGMWKCVIEPWKKLIPLSEWWWDAGSHNPWRTISKGWIKWLKEEQGIEGGVEALGILPDASIDPVFGVEVAQLGLLFDSKDKIGYFHPDFPNMVAPKGSNMYIALVAKAGPQGPEWSITVKELVDILERGFNLAPDEAHDEIVEEAYAKFKAIQLPLPGGSTPPKSIIGSPAKPVIIP